MTQRSFRGIKSNGPFCPKWGTIIESYVPEGGRYPVEVGDLVRVQFRKYEEIFDAKVMKIVANKETGVVAEVSVILQGDTRQWRTVTPDKIRRVPRNRQEEEEEMKVTGFKGELPKRTGGGRQRAENPFDSHFSKGGTHKVELDKDDDADAIERQIRNAASFASKGVRIVRAEDGTLLFAVTEKKTRKPRETAAAAAS